MALPPQRIHKHLSAAFDGAVLWTLTSDGRYEGHDLAVGDTRTIDVGMTRLTLRLVERVAGQQRRTPGPSSHSGVFDLTTQFRPLGITLRTSTKRVQLRG